MLGDNLGCKEDGQERPSYFKGQFAIPALVAVEVVYFFVSVPASISRLPSRGPVCRCWQLG
jgi:hypothetical protein